jgi:hypothetical protein
LRTRVVGAAPALALLAVIAVLAGCSLFEPRDPEESGGGGAIPCLTRTTADSVIANVEANYARTAGIGCYASGLSEVFAFHPDPADSIEAGQPGGVSPYANWNAEVESRVAVNLASDASTRPESLLVSFDGEYAPRDVAPDGRTETRHYTYRIRYWSRQLAAVAYGQGLADITLVRGNDNFWTITVWLDKRDTSGNPTWGRLRRNYRTGF